jgi:uncharacterized protein YeaO (DUF488 family)
LASELEGKFLGIISLKEMIKTKSVNDSVNASDGYRILVMRRWPRGIGYKKNGKRGMIDKRCKELAPSLELLNNWNKGQITRKDYVIQYRKEQAAKPEAKADRDFIIKWLAEKPNVPVTLLCKEPEHDPHCHRYLLKDILEKEISL